MGGDNVPDDWGNYFTKCQEGHRFHESEDGCGICVTCIGCHEEVATDTDDLCDDCREAQKEAKPQVAPSSRVLLLWGR